MVPTPYDMRWTSRLIYRDLKGIAASCTKKVRSLLSSTPSASKPAVKIHNPHTLPCAPIQQHEVENENEPPVDAGVIHKASTPGMAPSPLSETVSPNNSTLLTEVSQTSLGVPITLYSILSKNLRYLYASRERDQPLVERWTFRGAWLLLHMATQYCTSNPSHDILTPGSSSVNETTLLLELLRMYTSLFERCLLTPFEEHSVPGPIDSPTAQVSQIPALPYTKSKEGSRRHDSGYHSIEIERLLTPDPPVFWYTIFSGATDQTKTVEAAEYLLGYVWPEKSASAILETVGDPAKRLSEDDEIELREKFGALLFPEHNALC